MNVNLFFSFILASAIVLVIPGPTILTVISQSINHGRKSTFPLIFGVLLGDFSAMSLSIVGLGAILQTSAVLFSLFKWIGAFYLVYLGLKSFLGNKLHKAKECRTEESSRQLFQSTFIVTILNPKSIAFFVAFFPQFVDPAGAMAHQFLVLGVTFLILAVINATLYSIFASKIGHFMKRKTVKSWFRRISGSILIGAGVMSIAIRDT